MTSSDLVASRSNPFVGPLALAVGDPIFGRDRELIELLQLLVTRRIVLLHAPSGAGKTSLVQAGLIPQLGEEGFHVLPVARLQYRPLDQSSAMSNRYLYSLLYSLMPGNQEMPPSGEPEANLADSLQSYRERNEIHAPTVLIIDQFEEIFKDPFDIGQKEDFFLQLGGALRDSNLWTLLVIRDDYVGVLMDSRYVRPLPTRLVNSYHLDLLSEKAAVQAIKNTVALGGREFVDGAVTKLVDNLRRVQEQDAAGVLTEVYGPYVEPVQLQIVCRKLWQDLPPEMVHVTEADIDLLEDDGPNAEGFDFVDRALADHYASEVARIAPNCPVDEREIRFWVQDKLISKDGVRIPVLREPHATKGLDNDAVEALLSTYLLRREERAGKIWYELTHDRLVRPVREDNERWFEENLRLLQRRAELWKREKDNPDSLLLLGETLAAEKAWADQNLNSLSSIDKEYLTACLQKQAAEEERLRDWEERLSMANELATQERELAKQEKKIRRRNQQLFIAVTALAVVAACAAALVVTFQFAAASNRYDSAIASSTSGAAQANANLSDANNTRVVVIATAESAKVTIGASEGGYEDSAQATAAFVNAQSTLSAANADVTLAASEGTAAAAQATALAPKSDLSPADATAGAATEAAQIALSTARVATAAAAATDSASRANATATAASADATARADAVFAIFPAGTSLRVFEAPGSNVSVGIVEGPQSLPVLREQSGWVEVALHQVALNEWETGWANGFLLTFEGNADRLSTDLELLFVTGRDDLQFVHGVVRAIGREAPVLELSPSEIGSGSRQVPAGTDVTVLQQVTGSTDYGSGIWYLVYYVSDRRIWKGYLPAEAVVPADRTAPG